MTRFQYKALVILLIVLLCVTLSALVYVLVYGSPLVRTRAMPQHAVAVVEAVSELAVLPENEKPTVVTVMSLEQLAGQPFFKNAKIGDKVLIYTQAQRAILYDPVAHKLVEVAPLTIDQNQTAP